MSCFTPTAPGKTHRTTFKNNRFTPAQKYTPVCEKKNERAENVHIFFRVFGTREHCMD